jgi:hypothetical protein
MMARRVPYQTLANWNPNLHQNDDGTAPTDTLMLAMLCAIRDELRRLNNVLQCPNFIGVPAKLDRIERNTRRKRKPRAVGKPKLRVVR